MVHKLRHRSIQFFKSYFGVYLDHILSKISVKDGAFGYKCTLRILTHSHTNGSCGYWPTLIQMDTVDIGPLSYKMDIADIDPLSMSYKDRGTVFYLRTLLLGLGRQYLCLFFGSLRSFLGQHPDDALERDRLRSRRSNASRGTSLGQQQSWWVIIRSRGFAVGDVGKCVCLHS